VIAPISELGGVGGPRVKGFDRAVRLGAARRAMSLARLRAGRSNAAISTPCAIVRLHEALGCDYQALGVKAASIGALGQACGLVAACRGFGNRTPFPHDLRAVGGGRGGVHSTLGLRL
jgi:hypothetical protein